MAAAGLTTAARRAEQPPDLPSALTLRLSAQRRPSARQWRKEATRLHVEAREAEVEQMNSVLASTYDEIDRLLKATLEVDDYLDPESLKSRAAHPEFNPGQWRAPSSRPAAGAAQRTHLHRTGRTKGSARRVRRQEEARRDD